LKSASFFFFATLASIWWFGAWDSQRAVERVLAQGYEADASIISLQQNRRWPLHWPVTLDGSRPRFIDQPKSIGIGWRGSDGVDHELQGAQVTDGYFSQIAVTEALSWRLTVSSTRIKVIEAEPGAAVVLPDAEARLKSLNAWRTYTGYPAAALWGLGALVFLWERSTGRHRSPSRHQRREFGVPASWRGRILAFALLCFAGAGYEPYRAWSESQRWEAVNRDGVEAVAKIDRPIARPASESVSYSVDLSWKDPSGGDRKAAYVRVSRAFWGQIMRGDALAVSETRVRYLEGEKSMKPLIVGDAEARWLAGPDWKNMGLLFGFGVFFAVAWFWVTERR
jgi:hypothetical protein